MIFNMLCCHRNIIVNLQAGLEIVNTVAYFVILFKTATLYIIYSRVVS